MFPLTTESSTMMPQPSLDEFLFDLLVNFTSFRSTEDRGESLGEEGQYVSPHFGAIVITGMVVVFIASVFCQALCVAFCKPPSSRRDGPLNESTLRAMEEGTLPLSQVPQARRKEYMAKVLIPKHVWLTNSKVKSETGRFERKASLLIEEASTEEDEDDEEDAPQITRGILCAICLNRYKNGERICFSQNEKCHHAFHKRCLEAWLAEHEECPCCRLQYVRRVTESSEQHDEDIGC